MSNNLHMLPGLKKRLVQATQFNKVFHYFFDHFGENPEFMKLGEQVQDKLLESLLAHVAGQALRTRIMVMQLLMIHLPQRKFIHGTGSMNGRVVSFFYFEDSKVGMLAIMGKSADAEHLFTRFSGMHMPPSQPNPSPN